MNIFIVICAAVVAYLIGGLNPAIMLSKAVYHKDIRTCGSNNPGFTNFKRCFGSKLAWLVFVLDIGKAAAAVAVFARLFTKFDIGSYQLGAAFTGLFVLFGHAFPVWYGFRGGKGFLVFMSVIWFVDWRSGLLATVLLVVLLLTTKYMSLSTMLAITGSVILLGIHSPSEITVIAICALQVLFIIVRHRKNIVRLANGTESKFSFGKKK